MDLTTITVDQFKARFYRDFVFANQNPNQQQQLSEQDYEVIQDQDIQNAFADAQMLLNQALFTSSANNPSASPNASITTGYLLLTAHCLVLNIRNSNSGANSASGFPVASRSAGSLSESYQIPDAYKDPIYASYTGTGYGMKYLQMVLPLTTGNMKAVFGGAHW